MSPSTHPDAPSPLPWLVAHRGARDERPENTVAAFECALRYPIDGIELDVQMAADQTLVIYHDPTIFRLNRRRKRLADLSRSEMAALDWGEWFHKDYAGTALLTLEQTLATFGPRTRLLVEIKSSEATRRTGHAERLTRRVVRALDEAAAAGVIDREHLFILSFDPEVLALAQAIAPQWPRVFNVPEYYPEAVMYLKDELVAPLWAVCVRLAGLTERLVRWAGERELRVFTYTCNTPRQVQKALHLGVDAILTDRPGWLTSYLNQK